MYLMPLASDVDEMDRTMEWRHSGILRQERHCFPAFVPWYCQGRALIIDHINILRPIIKKLIEPARVISDQARHHEFFL